MAVDIQYMRGLDNKRRPPIVRYKTRARFDQALTDRNGRSMYVDEDVAEITSPDGGVTLTKTVKEWFETIERDPAYMQWAPAYKQMYRDWKDAHDATKVEGTPVTQWPFISPAQCEMLLQSGYRSIEQVAQMSEEATATIDGGSYLRSKARFWVNAAEDIGAVASEAASLKAENETLRADNELKAKHIQELKSETERLTQHFTGKEGYDVIAGRVQPVGLQAVQTPQPVSSLDGPLPVGVTNEQETPLMPSGPVVMSLADVQTLSMSELRDYCYERDVKPHTSKDETYKRLQEAGQVA